MRSLPSEKIQLREDNIYMKLCQTISISSIFLKKNPLYLQPGGWEGHFFRVQSESVPSGSAQVLLGKWAPPPLQVSALRFCIGHSFFPRFILQHSFISSASSRNMLKSLVFLFHFFYFNLIGYQEGVVKNSSLLS